MLQPTGLVFDFGAEVASNATVEAGDAWRTICKSFQRICDTGLKPNTAADLLADECNLSREQSQKLAAIIRGLDS